MCEKENNAICVKYHNSSASIEVELSSNDLDSKELAKLAKETYKDVINNGNI